MSPKEIRKKLTAVQAKHLSDSQEALTKARTALAEADKNARQILTLIFDAIGLPEDAVVRFDDVTQELVALDESEIQDADLAPAATSSK